MGKKIKIKHVAIGASVGLLAGVIWQITVCKQATPSEPVFPNQYTPSFGATCLGFAVGAVPKGAPSNATPNIMPYIIAAAGAGVAAFFWK